MKIGILQCDDVVPELQPEFGNYPEMFKSLLQQADANPEFSVFDVRRGDYPARLADCDAYITTGSRHGVLDGLAWEAELEEFIRRADAARHPFVGICFGHQAMARALGGTVEQSPRGWGVGVACYGLKTIETWMDPFDPELSLVVSHQDQVAQLPQEMRLLAGNEFCPYYLVQRGEHMLGLQGHPEFSREYCRALLDRRRHIIPGDRLEQGLRSLACEIHPARTANWLVRFMQNAARKDLGAD